MHMRSFSQMLILSSVIVHFGPSRDKEDVCINNNVLTTDDKVTHLGIVRDCNSKYSSKFVTEERISICEKDLICINGCRITWTK